MNDTNAAVTPDLFDRQIGSLHGLPDVLSTKPSVVQTAMPITGDSQTFTIQTYRQQAEPEDGTTKAIPSKDTIFLQCVNKNGTTRIALPWQVANAIARQREALTGKSRSKRATQVAKARKDRGELPGFMKVKEVGA